MDKNNTVISSIITDIMAKYVYSDDKMTSFKVTNSVEAGISASGKVIVRKPSFKSDFWGFGYLALQLFDKPTWLAKFSELSNFTVDSLLSLLYNLQTDMFGGGFSAVGSHYSLDTVHPYQRIANDGTVIESGVIFDVSN